MARSGHIRHAVHEGRPRRRDNPLWAWMPADGGLVDDASLSDLLSRAETYDRVGDPFTPAGIVACANGLEGILEGGGSCRMLFRMPVLAPGEHWDRKVHGDAVETLIREAVEAAKSEPRARAALDIVAYLASRGRMILGLAFMPAAAGADGGGEPAHAVACDTGSVAFLLQEGDGHLLVARDRDTAAVAAVTALERLWTHDGAKPHTEPVPPALMAMLRDMGERVLRPARTTGAAGRARAFAPGEVLRFAMLRDAPLMPGGRQVGIESAPVAPWPHQSAVARRVVEGFPRSWLLADEVGLGKTIEAGLALRALTLSGTCARALVAAPASLCGQWQREMRLKFALEFDVGEPGARGRLYEPDRLIVSRNLLASNDAGRVAALAGAAPWDVVVADEAHGARRGTNLAATIGDSVRPRCSSLLLATATPMQLQPRDAFDLNRWAGRGGAFDGDDTLSEAYYEILETLPDGASGSRPAVHQFALVAEAMREQERLDPGEWKRAWSVSTASATDAARGDIRALLDGEEVEVPPRAYKAFRHLAYAVAPLGRTMLRHGRSILHLYESHGLARGMRLPRRTVRAKALASDARERDVSVLLDAYLTGLTRKLSGSGRKAARGAAFYASFVRLRAASSDTAAVRTFRRRLAKVETCLGSEAVRASARSSVADLGEAVLGDDDTCHVADEAVLKDRTVEDLAWEAERLRGLLVALGARGGEPTSKASALLETLSGAEGRACVVFTRFRDTLDEIVSVVEAHAPYLRLGTYSGTGGAIHDPREGRLVPRDREEVTAAIQAGLLDVLVCTDAAAEGLNLQRAGLLVNYDLPWNPTKVEQRIGRIDRIGQVHGEVEVVNLIYQGSAEERVYARLLARLDAIGSIVGSQQISLIPLSEGDFLTLAAPDVTEARKAALLERAQAAAVAAARRIQARETPAKHLLSMYWNEEEVQRARRVPARLGDLWNALATSPTLAAHGFTPREDGNLALPDGIAGARPYMLTVDRDLHAVGMSPDGVRTAFATWGDPVVESVFRLFGERPLPAFARRLEARVRVASRDVPVVGYAVATPAGPVLYTSVDDIRACPPDPAGTVTEADAARLLDSLRAMADAEYADAAAIAGTERASAEAARDRRRLVRAVCLAALDQRSGTGSFESEISTIEAKVLAMPHGPATFVARVDGTVAEGLPGTFQAAGGKPGRFKVSTDPVVLRSAVALAREVRADLRKGDAAEMRDVFLKILVDAREGRPGPDPREAFPDARPVIPTPPVHVPVPSSATWTLDAPMAAIAPPPARRLPAGMPSVPVPVADQPSGEAATAVPADTVPADTVPAPATEPAGHANVPAHAIVPTDVAPPAVATGQVMAESAFPRETVAEFRSSAADMLVFALAHGDARGYLAVAYGDAAAASAAVEATFVVDETLGAVLEASSPLATVVLTHGGDGHLGGSVPAARPCALIMECPRGEVPPHAVAAGLLRDALSAAGAPASVSATRPSVPVSGTACPPATIEPEPVAIPPARPVAGPVASAVPPAPLRTRTPGIEMVRDAGDGSFRLERDGRSVSFEAAEIPELIRLLSRAGGAEAARACEPGQRRARPANDERLPVAMTPEQQDRVVLARLYAVYPEGLRDHEVGEAAVTAGLPERYGHAALGRLGGKGWVRRSGDAWTLVPDVKRQVR